MGRLRSHAGRTRLHFHLTISIPPSTRLHDRLISKVIPREPTIRTTASGAVSLAYRPDRVTPGPLFALPVSMGGRETGSWTPAASPGLSVNRPACSCSGLMNAGSPVCCSRSRPGSRVGNLLARSPFKHSLGEDHPAKTIRVCMFGMGKR